MADLEETLDRHFSFRKFLPGQREVVERVTAGRSAAAIFPTGAGKSLCYQLPAMLLPDLTLVVSPLLSLMKDQLDFLRGLGLPAARLDSTLDREASRAVLDDARKNRLKILMISVERFKNERFRHHLRQMTVSLLVVDEAHCISEWGHNFRPEYLKLPAYRREFDIPQALLLTATATPRVVKDMRDHFGLAKDDVVTTGFYRPNLELWVSPTSPAERDARLLELLREAPGDPTIVYVTLQRTAESVAARLEAGGIRCACYHAGMPSEIREGVQRRFMAGGLDCVVATIAFGMGIDRRDIRRVIHYDLPKSIENYSQEIGRAGRDGRPAHCRVLAGREHLHVLENFVYGDTPEAQGVRRLVEMIHQHPEGEFRVRPHALGLELNIRPLPLRTLLVYLDMAGILRPRATFFESYAFKFISPAAEIAARFSGRRREFVDTLLGASVTKRTWTHVPVEDLVENRRLDRRRIVAALEYFDAQGWVELQARQVVDAWEILRRDFDPGEVAARVHRLFRKKEAQEIARIHDLLAFLEGADCINRRLAAHFGQAPDFERCGHCSACKEGATPMPPPAGRRPLREIDLDPLVSPLRSGPPELATAVNQTRFLCGITAPVLTNHKLTRNRNFGTLEGYPFGEVLERVRRSAAPPQSSPA